DLALCETHQETIAKCEKRSRVGWGICAAGGGLMVAGMVAGFISGIGTVAAIPGILVTFSGLGLAQWAQNKSDSARLDYQFLYPTSMNRRNLLDTRTYPRLREVQAALKELDERDLKEVQSMVDGIAHMGQVMDRGSSMVFGGTVLRKSRRFG
ncbi:MAG: hypothetical protein AB1758_04610, partial [Candidatus Eremiobacterota bacterium]